MDYPVKALMFTSPQRVEIGDFLLPMCESQEVIVKTHFSTVSTGTELRVLSGREVRSNDPSYYPLIPGYSVVGEIVEIGADVRGWQVGDVVSVRNSAKTVAGIRSTYGGHVSYHVCPTSGNCQPVLLPVGANPLDYAAVEVAAISHRGVRAVAVQPGETAVVLGQGIIGAMSAAWLIAAGARVCVVDLAENRLKRASQWGASAGFMAQHPALLDRVKAFTGGGADIVVESTGTMAGVKLAGSLIRNQRIVGTGSTIRWPRLLFQASYTDEYSAMPTKLFVGEGAVVISPDDRGVEDRYAAIEAFRTGVLKPEWFIDRIMPYTEAQSAYDGLRTQPNDFFSVVFDWRS